MDCTSRSAVGKKGLPSSRWDCLCATENIDTVEEKKEMYASSNLIEEKREFDQSLVESEGVPIAAIVVLLRYLLLYSAPLQETEQTSIQDFIERCWKLVPSTQPECYTILRNLIHNLAIYSTYLCWLRVDEADNCVCTGVRRNRGLWALYLVLTLLTFAYVLRAFLGRLTRNYGANCYITCAAPYAFVRIYTLSTRSF